MCLSVKDDQHLHVFRHTQAYRCNFKNNKTLPHCFHIFFLGRLFLFTPRKGRQWLIKLILLSKSTVENKRATRLLTEHEGGVTLSMATLGQLKRSPTQHGWQVMKPLSWSSLPNPQATTCLLFTQPEGQAFCIGFPSVSLVSFLSLLSLLSFLWVSHACESPSPSVF